MERGADREGNFGRGFGSVAITSVLSYSGVSPQVGRALNVCPIHYDVDQILVTFVGRDARGGYRVSEMTVLI